MLSRRLQLAACCTLPPLLSLIAAGCSGDANADSANEAAADSGEGGRAGEAGARASGSAGEAGMGDGGSSGNGGSRDMDEPGGRDGGEAGSGPGGRGPLYPELLSEAGLYADLEAGTLADGVVAYKPRYELWSDGAEKQRWIKLPSGSIIDTSDLDYWNYPIGTKLFKEFTRDGVRVETRMLHKRESGWVMIAYLWSDEGDAVAVPDGARNASGTPHDVPDQDACATCHDKMPDVVLGFTALQLSHEEEGATLRALIESDLLSDPPDEPLEIPGDQTAQNALGYMHANCGICHHPESFVSERASVMFWLATDELDSVESTSTYRTSVGREPEHTPPSGSAIIAPGDAEGSTLYLRMQLRGPEEQMPPLATEDPDEAGLSTIRAWIESL